MIQSINRRPSESGDKAPRSKYMRLRDKLTKWWRDPKRETATPLHDPDLTNETDHVDPFNPFPDPINIEISDVFDLHTIAPRDVKRVVEEYLLESRRLKFHSVRIIHGKGIGVQREMVRSILARTPFVETFTDAPPQAGGSGATIAHLSIEDE